MIELKMTTTYSSISKEFFVKEINRLRRNNLGKWYYFEGKVENKNVKLKAFDTYLQIFEVNSVRFGGLGDISIKQFIAELNKPFN